MNVNKVLRSIAFLCGGIMLFAGMGESATAAYVVAIYLLLEEKLGE